MSVLGLPDNITACLFDLDGVLTQTAKVHAAAWTQIFDEFLRARAAAGGPELLRPRRDEAPRPVFVPFSAEDYNAYVDGRPRADGVRTFLASRHIELPEGTPEDGPDAPTINGLGSRKNEVLLSLVKTQGVQPYAGSVRYLHAARDAGLLRAVVSASANCADVLAAAGLTDLLQVRVDGLTIVSQHLHGKPAPDSFLAAARELGVAPGDAAIFEDAIAGVQAGRAGGFGAVVGVDRVHHADALRANGASIVVSDLTELLEAA